MKISKFDSVFSYIILRILFIMIQREFIFLKRKHEFISVTKYESNFFFLQKIESNLFAL